MGRGTGSNLLYGEAAQAARRQPAPRRLGELHSRFTVIVPALRHAKEKGLDAFKAGYLTKMMSGALSSHDVEEMLRDLVEVGAVARSTYVCCPNDGNTVAVDPTEASGPFHCECCAENFAALQLLREDRYEVLLSD